MTVWRGNGIVFQLLGIGRRAEKAITPHALPKRENVGAKSGVFECMTNSYALIRAIVNTEGMTNAEKVAGVMLSLHLNRRKNQIAVRQSVIAKECGLTERCVCRAVAKMVRAGIFEKHKVKTCVVLVPLLTPDAASVKESVYIMKRNKTGVSCITRTQRVVSEKNRLPWDYDLTYSTAAEEKAKREENRFLREVGENG